MMILKKNIFFVFIFASFAMAQNLCPRQLLDEAAIVNIEGRFVNEERSRTHIDIEWHHHSELNDTFFVQTPKEKPYLFITAGEFRYIEWKNPRFKRQLGLHHLRETIGNTPLKLDDLELLANGYFACPDTSKKANALFTAMSNMWYSMSLDSLEYPQNLTMRGAKKETRKIHIGAWKDFSGLKLPTLVKIMNDNYRGDLWVRSASKILPQKDPLIPYLIQKKKLRGHREIPLIFQLNQQFLRD